jgi:hypothetical protein
VHAGSARSHRRRSAPTPVCSWRDLCVAGGAELVEADDSDDDDDAMISTLFGGGVHGLSRAATVLDAGTLTRNVVAVESPVAAVDMVVVVFDDLVGRVRVDLRVKVGGKANESDSDGRDTDDVV